MEINREWTNIEVDIKSMQVNDEIITYSIKSLIKSNNKYLNLIKRNKENNDNIIIPNYFTFLSENLKKELDIEYGNPWQVIIGDNYGSYFTFEENNFLLFTLNNLWITIFKSSKVNS